MTNDNTTKRIDRTVENWRERNSYYYDWLDRIYASNVRPGSRVLHVGCQTGDLLEAVKPSYGVGIDTDEKAIESARQRFPDYRFEVQDPHAVTLDETFDYILICNSIGTWSDIQQVFEKLRPLAHEDTRIIVTYYSYLWEGLLRAGSFLGMRRPNSYQNWLPPEDIVNFLYLSNYDTIRSESMLMMPKRVPLLSAFCNHVLSLLPGFRALNLINLVIARPNPAPKNPDEVSVSVVVPCRNERGNIEGAITRIPLMGKWTEIVFVDGK